MNATQEIIEARQRKCHVCKHIGTLCDTREREIVERGEVYHVDEINTLVADYNGEPICEDCIAEAD